MNTMPDACALPSDSCPLFPPATRTGALARIGLISNANSGCNRLHLGGVHRILSRHAGLRHVVTGSADEVRHAVAELAREHIDVLAINGGDGTAASVLGHVLAQAPFATRPRVVLLPGGTVNMAATAIGTGGDLLRAATRLSGWLSERPRPCTEVRQPILRVQLGDHGATHHGMFLGAGAVIKGTEYAHRRVHAMGLRGSESLGLALTRTLWGLQRRDPRFSHAVPVTLTLDDGPPLPQQDALILLVSSLQRLSLGMCPFWGSENGAVRLTLIRPQPARFLRSLPSVLRGRPGPHVSAQAGYLSHNAHHLSLLMDGTLNLDGEIHHVRQQDGPVRIASGGEFTFLRP